MIDLLRLMLVLDTWGHEEQMSRLTVGNYLTGTKHHYTVERPLLGATVSSVWGPKGHNHPLVTMLLQSIPVRHRPMKRLLTTAWIRDGFQHCWSTHEYVAIAFLLGWVLRVGEGCNELDPHIIMWSMITFSVYWHETWQELPMSHLRGTPCDMMELHQQSRKYQEGPRCMPGRMNTCHLADPSLGATTWCHLCMPTVLQGWAILNNVDKMSPTERAQRPVLAPPGSIHAITRDAVSDALRRLARLRHEDETTVVPTCLRKTSITELANSEVINNSDRFLRTVGHHDLRSSEPYIVPGPLAAAAITAVQQLANPEELLKFPSHHTTSSS